MFSFNKEKPAAGGWPPYIKSKPEQEFMAFTASNPFGTLTDPLLFLPFNLKM